MAINAKVSSMWSVLGRRNMAERKSDEQGNNSPDWTQIPRGNGERGPLGGIDGVNCVEGMEWIGEESVRYVWQGSQGERCKWPVLFCEQ